MRQDEARRGKTRQLPSLDFDLIDFCEEKCLGKCLKKHFWTSRFHNFLGGGGYALRPPSGFRPLVLFWSLVTAYLKGDMLSLRMALTSDNLALPLIFLNLLRWHLSKFSQFGNIILPIIQKPKKIGVTMAVSSLYAILCFLPPSQFVLWTRH